MEDVWPDYDEDDIAEMFWRKVKIVEQNNASDDEADDLLDEIAKEKNSGREELNAYFDSLPQKDFLKRSNLVNLLESVNPQRIEHLDSEEIAKSYIFSENKKGGLEEACLLSVINVGAGEETSIGFLDETLPDYLSFVIAKNGLKQPSSLKLSKTPFIKPATPEVLIAARYIESKIDFPCALDAVQHLDDVKGLMAASYFVRHMKDPEGVRKRYLAESDSRKILESVTKEYWEEMKNKMGTKGLMAFGLECMLNESNGSNVLRDYNNSVSAIETIDIVYTPKDIEEFSSALWNIIDSEDPVKRKAASAYLSGLINSSEEDEFTLRPLVSLDYMGCYLNEKKVTIHGSVGDYSGFSMKDSELIINGDAGALAGSKMDSGTIRISGDAQSLSSSEATGRIHVNGKISHKTGLNTAELDVYEAGKKLEIEEEAEDDFSWSPGYYD